MRAVILALAFAASAPAWVESVEFPWATCPQPLWQRELAWLKNIGITHVSLPPGDAAQLNEVIRIVRRLSMEADLEGPVPEALLPLTKAHGGPLTDPLTPVRISVLRPDALTEARERLESGAAAILWTDVEDTFGPAGYKAGAVSFAGEERSGTTPVRRNAQLSAFWRTNFSELKELPATTPPKLPTGITVRQFTGPSGISVVSVINRSNAPWTGEVRALYPVAKKAIGIPSVTVPAHDSLWLPVNIPLLGGNAFAALDHVIYANAELIDMEYENGILAMEFAAPKPGEVILQLSREPYGPLVAGAKPTPFDWDTTEHRARLTFPAGAGPGSKVRIGLAIEPPDATAFFDSAKVLVIGETNHLPAQYSSEAIAQRSRLRTSPGLEVNQQEPGKEPLVLTFDIKVPGTFIHGDHAELAIEADGQQMSHASPQLLRPASLSFPEQIDIHVARNSALPLFPATVPVNQRTGRDVTIAIRNNAPEIRNFELELTADGLDFSPARLPVSVGASTSREVSFRVFTSGATPGLHTGAAKLSGAASATEPVQFLVIPPTGSVSYSVNGFQIEEAARTREVSFGGLKIESVDKSGR
ncbi:MAG TPA: hypothetical protein VEF06_08995 [Bryobacteraceae bacterium]|nr:hypothetical protein [Bryobacteraceae bacterium]